LGMGRDDAAVLPPPVPQGAARPQLGEPGGAERGVRPDALVAQAWCRRLPYGCGESSHFPVGGFADGARKINFISKAPGLPDAPITQPGRDFQPFDNLSINRPQVHEWLKEMNKEVLSVSAT
jgi:hypothetical protein